MTPTDCSDILKSKLKAEKLIVTLFPNSLPCQPNLNTNEILDRRMRTKTKYLRLKPCSNSNSK